MAVNPTLAVESSADGSNQLFPLPKAGESFILKRDGIAFECTLHSGHRLSGSGCFFLSSKRIVFVAKDSSCRPDFKSFEISLQSLLEPSFEQPIFGANYLAGKAGPVTTGAFTHDPASAPLGGQPAPFSLTFNYGGCQTFLDRFFAIMEDVRRQRPNQQTVQDGRLQQVAYVDPSDPSVLYVTQPTAVQGSEQATAFEVEDARPAEVLPTFQPGDAAEVVILEGPFAGKWAKCTIRGPGTDASSYSIHVTPTTDFNSVNGFADKEISNIQAVHLRKPGTPGIQPNLSGEAGGSGCAVS